MAGHAGLQRVVKTVKGKKGSTHRAYWVKSPGAGPAAKAATAGPHPSLHRVNNAAIAGMLGGMLGAGIHYAAGGGMHSIHRSVMMGGALGAIGGAMHRPGSVKQRRNRK